LFAGLEKLEELSCPALMVKALLFCIVGALAVKVSPVQKVIQLLDELKGKVEADLSTEEKMMEEYTTWCDEEANEKEDAITSSKRTIGDLSATIEDAEASILTLTASIDELTTKISTSETELANATEIRDKENAVFLAAEKELVETVDSLERAIMVLKKNLGFMQTGRSAHVMEAMAAGLKKVVEASWVNAHQKAVLQSLLQTSAEESDQDLEFQPQGNVVAYESSSGGILDTIADMQSKAEESLSSTRKDEMEAAHAYAMVKQGLEGEIAVAKKQLSEATLTRSTTTEELNNAKSSLSETKTTLAADEKYLEELKQSCTAKATEWAGRQKQASEETAAIQKAKEILSEGVKVFLQTSSRTQLQSEAEEALDSRSQVVRLLKKLAKSENSYALAQLASQARSDPFGKIRGLIEEMIAKLTAEAAEEADQKSFCDEEIGESKAKQADLSGKLDKTTARISKAEAGKAKLLEEIKMLETEISEMDAGQAEATKVRQEEHAEYLKASKDFKDSAAAVAKAIDVLTEYYGSAAFVQVSAKQPEFGGAKGDVGSTIVSVLEVAESDFTELLAETEADETSAQESYDKLTQENAVTKATKTGAVKAKTSEVKQLEVAIGNYKENKATTTEELDAVLAYLDKLKPQCETKVMSYADKKAKREQEISGLKEALTILSSEAFLQVKTTLRAARRS
jgi:chromosome segregation ATPase